MVIYHFVCFAQIPFVAPSDVNDLELAVGWIFDTFSFAVVGGQGSCNEKPLIRRELVLLIIGALYRVTDDCDLGDVDHDHDFGVEEDAGDEDEHDRDKGTHVALIGTARPFKVDLHCRLAYGELVVGSELASDLTIESNNAMLISASSFH